ncbi:MAG: aldose epimerase family protein [Opitutus sp.]
MLYVPTCRPFGHHGSGQTVECWTLRNASGATIDVLTYGGIVRSLSVPDAYSRIDDVVLGFDSLEPYLAGHPYFGAITGRIAGRVTAGELAVSGQTYQLHLNDGQNHLHGGKVGLDKRVWRAEPFAQPDGSAALRLSYRSPDGEEEYPGTLDITITYTLTPTNAFIVESTATTDQTTPLCLAHHSYFNLEGEISSTIANHDLEVFADECVPTDDSFTLTGRRVPVDQDHADFRTPRRLAEAMPRLFKSHGACYPLRAPSTAAPALPTLAARLFAPKTGRVLEVSTDDFVLQTYTASMLDGTLTGKCGERYGPHRALCLECQGYPDAAMHPEFGDILVYPDRPQKRTTIYAFSTR